MMTRPGLPIPITTSTRWHISIGDYHAGMETQADGDWKMYFDPWSIMTVQQAEDGQNSSSTTSTASRFFSGIYPRSRAVSMILSGVCSA